MSISTTTWQTHFTCRWHPWPAEPRPLLAGWEPGDLAGWLDAEDIPEGLPFLLDPAGGYDVELNRYLLPAQVSVAPLNTQRAIAYDLANWLSFLWCNRRQTNWRDATSDDRLPTSAGAAGTRPARTWRARPGRGRSPLSTASTGGRSVRAWSQSPRSSSGRRGSGGAYVDPAAGRMRFGPWAERWYNSTAHLKPTTRRDYRKLLDQQVLPRFRDVPLASIDTLAVEEWLSGVLAGDPKADPPREAIGAKRAGKALQVLSQALGAAVKGKRLAVNPAAGVSKPKGQPREMHFLDLAQVERLAEAIRGPYGVLIRFAATRAYGPAS